MSILYWIQLITDSCIVLVLIMMYSYVRSLPQTAVTYTNYDYKELLKAKDDLLEANRTVGELKEKIKKLKLMLDIKVMNDYAGKGGFEL